MTATYRTREDRKRPRGDADWCQDCFEIIPQNPNVPKQRVYRRCAKCAASLWGMRLKLMPRVPLTGGGESVSSSRSS